MHYPIAPHEEAKVARCISGAIYDVIVDLWRDPSTVMQWIATELTAADHRVLYISENFAHGFQTMEDNTEVLYQMTEFSPPQCGCGVRGNDPVFGIQWVSDDRIISVCDDSYRGFVGTKSVL